MELASIQESAHVPTTTLLKSFLPSLKLTLGTRTITCAQAVKIVDKMPEDSVGNSSIHKAAFATFVID